MAAAEEGHGALPAPAVPGGAREQAAWAVAGRALAPAGTRPCRCRWGTSAAAAVSPSRTPRARSASRTSVAHLVAHRGRSRAAGRVSTVGRTRRPAHHARTLALSAHRRTIKARL